MKSAVASIVAATAASACCIGPVLFVLLGVGGLGASFAAMEPYRPVLLALTAGAMGFAFYGAYRPQTACDDCARATRRRIQITVWLAAAFVAVLVTFPYYVNFIF